MFDCKYWKACVPMLLLDMIFWNCIQLLKYQYRYRTIWGLKDPLSICSLVAAIVSPVSLSPSLTPDCAPVAIQSRKYSTENRNFIEQEIRKLLSEGIIEENRSPWLAQIVDTRNEKHKKQKGYWYPQTINRFTLLDAYSLTRMDELLRKASRYEVPVLNMVDLCSAYHQIPILSEDKPYAAFEACGRLYQFLRIPSVSLTELTVSSEQWVVLFNLRA